MSSPDFTNDERFDGLYMNVANTARGIEPLLDTMFSFLRRKTDFFNGPNGESTDVAVQKVNEVLQKHIKIHQKEKEMKEKKKKKADDEKRSRKQQQEKQKKVEAAAKNDGVIEMDADQGFDISSPSSTSASTTAQDPTIGRDENPSMKEETSSPSTASIDKDEKTSANKNDNEEEEEENDGPAPLGNGGTVEGKYTWTQTLSELNVSIPLPENTRGRDLNVIMKKNHLSVALKSQQQSHLINAPLSKSIICDDSFWTVEDGNKLVINLQKLNQMEWWDCVCVGDPKIDVKKVQPENSKLDELDGDTRQTVEKMMFDQRQKAMGLPTSDEQKKFEMLEKFKAAHPEMDFSNAKLS